MKILYSTFLTIIISVAISSCGKFGHRNKGSEISPGPAPSSESRMLTEPVVKTDQPYNFANSKGYTGCTDLKPVLDQKTIDVSIKFDNFMGTNQGGLIKLKLDSINCHSSGMNGVIFRAKKTAGTEFSTYISLDLTGDTGVLNVTVSDCVANTFKGLIDGLKSDGAVINDTVEQQVMNNVTYEYCPIAIDGIVKAIIAEVQN